MNYRLWDNGIKVVDRNGFKAVYLCQYNGYCWIIYDGETTPQTVPAWTLEEV